ncbi:hypothetical protein Val02_26950 [Virgisporangium aliadipatigenens]|uniref:Uncharacterized protein n=1 Tax=Virgisporangium aliadipatigenens TaxID=741659 RepID=A0A8J3YIA1_9ACTN|nr:hypothetical protein [Virgisporangium aliadipatigenens]GIJ45809.1 hypothetical protein Val02_26950 [Virgisporangium aliadipatigenens]
MRDEKAAPGEEGGDHELTAGQPDSTGRRAPRSSPEAGLFGPSALGDRVFLDSTDECLRARLTPASYASSAAASGLQLSVARLRLFGLGAPYLLERGNGRYWFSCAVIARLAGFADSDGMFRHTGVPRSETPGRGWRGPNDEPLFGELVCLLWAGVRGPWRKEIGNRFVEAGWFEHRGPFDVELLGPPLVPLAGNDGAVRP